MTAVLVVGTGRSGTSLVARLLHESGIYMGSDFIWHHDDKRNIHFCCYEDPEFYWPIKNLLVNRSIDQTQWQHQATHYVQQRNEAHAVWGVKETRIADMPEKVLSLFPADQTIIIRCTRRWEQVVQSWVKNFGSDAKKIGDLIATRNRNLDVALRTRDHLVLDFSTHRDPAVIQERLIAYVTWHLPSLTATSDA